MKLTKSLAIKLYTENKWLKTQISDMKISLKLHKEMWNTYSCQHQDSTESSIYISELQKTLSEKSMLEKAYNDLKERYSNELISTKSKIEKIKSENFQWHNAILEKDSIIKYLSSSFNKGAWDSKIIIITNINQALLELNDELRKRQPMQSLNKTKPNLCSDNMVYDDISMTTLPILKDSQFIISFDSINNCEAWNKRIDSLESSLNSSSNNSNNDDNNEIDQNKILCNLTLPEDTNIREGFPTQKYDINQRIKQLQEMNSYLEIQLSKVQKQLKQSNKKNQNEQSMNANMNFGSIIDQLQKSYESYNISVSNGNNESLNKTIISWMN